MKAKVKLRLLLTMVLGWLCGTQPMMAQTPWADTREAFIELQGELDDLQRYQIANLGAVITGRYDNFITVRLPKDLQTSALLTIDGVNYIKQATRILTCSDSARFYSNVDKVLAGEGLERPYTGKGVIVGIIDCGFDFNHINLCDQDGNSRVKAVYMPLDTTGTPPVIRAVRMPGSCYETPEQIARLTTDDTTTSHGTMIAGIAAGSYRENGWYGMAPEADIVVCAIPEAELNDVKVANCLSYINDYATRKGKPCVVNISLGTNVGRHNGTSYLARVCQQFSGPGRVFVVSAGNDGADPVYAHSTISNNQDTITTLVRGFTADLHRKGYVNAWTEPGKMFNTRLIVVNTHTGRIVYRSRPLGTTVAGVNDVFSSEDDPELAKYYTGKVTFYGSIGMDRCPNALFDIDMEANGSAYVMGFQYFTPMETEIKIWGSQYAHFDSYGYSWALKGSSTGSINEIAATDSVISVGSYNTRQYLTLRDGTEYWRYYSEPVKLSVFSAYGPDANGIQRPDVCAPGSMLVSSGNRYFVNPPNLEYWQPSVFVDGEEYPYCPDLGTSMSAPVVAGTVALWLEANPRLSTGQVREVLRNSSYKDKNVTSANAMRWGTGKLNANGGLRYVLHIEDKNGDVNADGEVGLSDLNVVIDIILGGVFPPDTMRRADVNNDGEVGISDINAIIDIILSTD